MNVYLHALKHVQKNFDYKPNEFIILQPTSPLRTAKSINESYKLYKSKKALSVISCVKSRYPEEWKFELSKRKLLKEILVVYKLTDKILKNHIIQTAQYI